MEVVLTMSIKKKKSVGRWQVATAKEKKRKESGKSKKKREVVPVQSRAQLIQPVGV